MLGLIVCFENRELGVCAGGQGTGDTGGLKKKKKLCQTTDRLSPRLPFADNNGGASWDIMP